MACMSSTDTPETAEELATAAGGDTALTPDLGPGPDPLLTREHLTSSPARGLTPEASVTFSLVTYNVLAECHRVRYDYSYTDSKYLHMPYRHKRIVQELSYLNADIVCMQEVETAYHCEYLRQSMESLGYESLFVRRIGEKHPEGEALFFKPSRFTLLQNMDVSYAELIEKEISQSGHQLEVKDALRSYLKREAVLLMARLRCNVTGRELVVGNTHVTYASTCPDIQCVQMALALRQLLEFTDGGSVPFVLAGDFNASPHAPAYQLAKDGQLSEQNAGHLLSVRNVDCNDGEKMAAFDLLRSTYQHSGSAVKSTYALVQGDEPAITTWNDLMCDCVDYLWINGLDAAGVWKVPAINHCIPTAIYPSDHLSLKAEYRFV